MTIRTTRWSPDTCGCQFEYEWDDTTSENDRVHTFKQVAKECASHAHLTGNNKKDMFDSSLEENRRKNFSFHEIIQNGPTTLFDTQPDGIRNPKTGVSINWTWTGTAPNRVLSLTVTGTSLTTQQRNTIQNVLNNRFGTGKVILQ